MASVGGGGFQSVDDIFESFSDIFSDFFGGGMGRARSARARGPRRGQDLRYLCEVSLQEVMLGTEKDLKFEVEGPCDTCRGSGSEPSHTSETCPR